MHRNNLCHSLTGVWNLEDLSGRGLLDETLVCLITEMGRTPRLNKWEGRDHWARAMSCSNNAAHERNW